MIFLPHADWRKWISVTPNDARMATRNLHRPFPLFSLYSFCKEPEDSQHTRVTLDPGQGAFPAAKKICLDT